VPKSKDYPKGYKYLEISKQEYRKLEHLEFYPFSMCPKSIVDDPNKNNKKLNKMKEITRSKLRNLKKSPCCNAHLSFYANVFRSFKDESNGFTYYIKIFRLICLECKMTFTVLPYFLNPHKIMTVIVIYTAIKDYIIKKDKDTLVFKVMQKRWYLQFYQAATDYIFQYRLSLLQILEKLSANNFYAPSKHLSFYQEKECFNFCGF